MDEVYVVEYSDWGPEGGYSSIHLVTLDKELARQTMKHLAEEYGIVPDHSNDTYIEDDDSIGVYRDYSYANAGGTKVEVLIFNLDEVRGI